MRIRLCLALIISLTPAITYAAESEPAPVDTIEASIVFPNGTLMRFMKKSSQDFEARKSKNSVCKMTFTKTVMANGKYREFLGFKGLQRTVQWHNRPHLTPLNKLNEANLIYIWYPYSLMRSKCWEADRDEVLEQPYITSSIRDKSYDVMSNIDYHNSLASYELLQLMRTLEVLSPLNIRHIKDFNYFVNELDEKGSIRKVTFQTKENTFPQKTRLYGKGHILFDKNGIIKEIEMTDYLDYWAKSPYAKISSIPALATAHCCRLSFSYTDGHYYPENVEVTCKWDNSRIGGSYALLFNPRRHPYKVNLEEDLHLKFTDFRELAYDKDFKGDSQESSLCYAPYRKEIWKTDFPKWINLNKLVSDLNISNESFWSQCERPTTLTEYSELYYGSQPISEEQKASIEKELVKEAEDLYNLVY